MRLLELFSGTGSVGFVFSEAGWEVVSVDLDPSSGATHTADIMQWDYKKYPPGHFDVIWSSPPCTQYSIARTRAKKPRDLMGADSIVARTQEIIRYFEPRWWFMENPGTGLLAKRDIVRNLPYKRLSYCSYGYPYKKLTFIWTNAVGWTPRAVCRQDCASCVDGRHAMTAQRGPPSHSGRVHDKCDVSQLYSIPRALVEEILLFSAGAA